MGAVCGIRAHAGAVLLLCAVLAIHAALPLAAELAAGDNNSLSYNTLGSDCRGSIGECLPEMDSEEFAMESESTRRILLAAKKNYIAINTLKKNSAPCLRPGLSYYSNCRRGGPVNSYNRDCSKIAHCRGGG